MKAYTEYAVEVNNENGFLRQIDVFQSYEEAVKFSEIGNVKLSDDEYINIIAIEYDENDNEIGFYTVG